MDKYKELWEAFKAQRKRILAGDKLITGASARLAEYINECALLDMKELEDKYTCEHVD